MIFIAGGSGFIGRHLIMTLKREGHVIMCLARSEDAERVLKKLGCEIIRGDITDRDSLSGALDGAKSVVNLVGIIKRKRSHGFRDIHVKGTMNLLDEAKKAGVQHFIYISSIGAGPGTPYHRTKGEAEDLVRESGIGFTILRPSIVVGPGDEFVDKIRGLIRNPLPIVPVPGNGNAVFQPIYVGDLVMCIKMAIEQGPDGRTIEVGGPGHLSYNRMLLDVAASMGKEKRLIHIPMLFVRPLVRILEAMSVGPITYEQLRMLELGNACSLNSVQDSFGFDPLPFSDVLGLTGTD